MLRPTLDQQNCDWGLRHTQSLLCLLFVFKSSADDDSVHLGVKVLLRHVPLRVWMANVDLPKTSWVHDAVACCDHMATGAQAGSTETGL